jgi:hypothetical protein
MTFAIREVILADIRPWELERCHRPQSRPAPAGTDAVNALSRADLIAAIREVEGVPVADPPLLFKLTVFFGFAMIGYAVGRTALIAAHFLGLA